MDSQLLQFLQSKGTKSFCSVKTQRVVIGFSVKPARKIPNVLTIII
jgi:hypothetical protein